jgi:chemotaxis protein MotA
MAEEKKKIETTKAEKKGSLRPDLATIGGIVVALGGILGGLILDGGRVGDVAQITAAFIVLGGTFGAMMIGTPLGTLMHALKRVKDIFLDVSVSPQGAVDEIIGYASRARKGGIVSLEAEVDRIADPFLRKALTLAVDGTDLQELRKMMELQTALEYDRSEAEAKVFEAAGGYSPTIGIIGAVLGLIQVMKHLANIEEVGRGIAVAFVATVYGVGAANIFFLPAANKLKARARRDMEMRELVVEGVVGIVEGLNPKLIRSKLDAYISGGEEKKPKKETPAAAKPVQPAKSAKPAAPAKAA